MNERIRELAEQAFDPINAISSEGVADRATFEKCWFQQYNQKFAELLIQEYAEELRKLNDGESVVVPKNREHAQAMVRVGMYYLEQNK